MAEAGFGGARILIVDDQQANVRLLERVLESAGYTQVFGTTDSREAVPLALQCRPDLILLDLSMPHMDGFEVMRQLGQHLSPDEYLPILVLTADITSEAKQQALSIGAKDFLTKPFEITEVLLRIRNLLHARFLHVALQGQNQVLDQKVRERTRQLEKAHLEILERLALAAEYRDDCTGRHTQRVGRLSALLAGALGLAEEEVVLFRRAAPLHDVGKIGIPDLILLKPGRLTPEEFAVMKTHTTIGARILSGGSFPLLKLAEEIALRHHERWDGSGYPGGLAGEAIPLSGRILAVADSFDALTHERPYKQAWPVEEAMAEVASQSGRQFDPRVVAAFLAFPPHVLHAGLE